jgi:hypothetical protein
MKRALGWMAGAVGIAALGRALSRRRVVTAPSPGPETLADDPAEELRRTLAASRGGVAGTGDDDEPGTLEERRARVHAKAQEAIDAMHDPGTDG